MAKARIPWIRFLGEAVLIVASVYVAIVLEGVSEDRDRRAEALAALSNLRAELVLDRGDFSEVMEIQEGHARRYANTIRWLADPLSMPTDSFGVDVVEVIYNNRTIFPRSSSWTTMIASGQLAYLGDQDLVARLANLYEHTNSRLDYNGTNYDDGVEDLARNAMPLVWDRVNDRLITTNEAAIAGFRGQLEWLSDWNIFYRELITDWMQEVDAVLAGVDDHLRLLAD